MFQRALKALEEKADFQFSPHEIQRRSLRGETPRNEGAFNSLLMRFHKLPHRPVPRIIDFQFSPHEIPEVPRVRVQRRAQQALSILSS